MKKSRLLLWLTLIFSLLMPLSAYAAEYAPDARTGSSDYREILSTEEDIRASIQRSLEIDPDGIDIPFEDAVKVYVNTGIENLKSDDEKAVTDCIQEALYVWVLSLRDEVHQQNVLITLSDENAPWHVAQLNFGEIPNYQERIAAVADDYDKVLCVGGIRGIQYPLLVGFKDGKAKEFIGFGYSYDALEEDHDTMNLDPDQQFYDFNYALEKLKEGSSTNSVLPSGGGTAADSAGGLHPGVLIIAALGMLAVILLARRFFRT